MESNEKQACCSGFHGKWKALHEMEGKFTKVPKCIYVVLGLLLVIQGVWIFMDASKRGLNKWLWGPIGFLNVPLSFIAYVFVTKRQFDIKCSGFLTNCCGKESEDE